MARNNKGFTMIEIIVSVIIVGILSAGLAVSISKYVNLDSEYGIDALQSALEKVRYKSMTSSSKITTELKLIDNGYKVVCRTLTDGKVYSSDRISSAKHNLVFVSNDIEYEIDKENSFYITYDRKDGSIESICITDRDNEIELGNDTYFTDKHGTKLKLSLLTGRAIKEN